MPAAKRKSHAAKGVKYDKEYIEEQLLSGVKLGEIGKHYGVNKHSVRQWMIRHFPDEYKAIMDSIAEDMAEEMLAVAYDDSIDIARARNVINSIQFRLARRHSNLYGDKVQTEVTHKGPASPVINITLSVPESTVAIEGQVIDAQPLLSTNNDSE